MKVGFDLDNYDFTEYASALDGENLSSTDCDMESESIWTPARRHKKRKASASPLNQVSYSEVVQSTIKKVPQIPKQRNVNSTKVFKYICIISCNSEKLGQQNQIKVQKLMSNLIGTVKSINSTKVGNLIVECIDNQQYKTLLKSTHLGEWVIKVYVPKSMNTSIGCIYNVSLNITEDDIKDVLKQQNVSNCVRLTYFDKEKKERQPSNTVKLYFNVPELPVRISLGFRMYKTKLFIPRPIQYFNCQQFGHMQSDCSKPRVCLNVINSMKINNVRLINQNVPTVKENTPLVVKPAPKELKNY